MSFSESPWTEPRPVNTRNGPRTVRRLTLTADSPAWAAWRSNKELVKAARFSLGKDDDTGGWMLTHWQAEPGQWETDCAMIDALAGKEAEEEEANRAAQVIDFVPADAVPLTTEAAMKLYPWQQPSCQRVIAALKTGNEIDASQTGCHAAGTLILMFDGTIKAVENITAGEAIMGWDNTPRRVIELKRGRQKMARIIPVKGAPFSVNLDHVLTLQSTNAGIAYVTPPPEFADVTVREYGEWSYSQKHLYKLFRRPVTVWPEAELGIDPYHLGVLIGDGCLVTPAAFALCKPGAVMLGTAHEIADSHGARLSTNGGPENPSHHFRNAAELWGKLDRMGLAGKHSVEKFIPQAYKAASWSQRAAILAGLMDTDGSLTHGGFDYISASRQLSEDVVFVARSLGLAAYVKQCAKGCQNGFTGTYWRVSISGETRILPCRQSNRIAKEQRQQIKSVLRTGFKVELLPEDDYYGFTIEGDGRYLMGDFTVTHNSGKTFIALAAAAELGVTPYVVAPLAVLESWRRAAKFMGVRLGGVVNYDKARMGSCPFVRKDMIEPPPAKNGKPGKPEPRFSFTPAPVRDLYETGNKAVLIFDEVQKCKTRDSLQGRMLADIARSGSKCMVLSATAAKDPTEMHGIGLALGLHTGGDSFIAFCRAHGCKPGQHGLKFSDNPKVVADCMGRIHRKLFPARGTRIRAADVPGYPENHVTASLVENKAIISAYADMEHELHLIAEKVASDRMSKLDAGANILAEIMKARRLSEHGKLDWIIDEAKELTADGFQVAIFLNFREHLNIVKDGLKLYSDPVWGTKWVGWETTIDGNGKARRKAKPGPPQKPEERQRIIDRFQDGKDKVILVSLAAGGAGISLHDDRGIAPRQSLISPSYSIIDLVQAAGRIWRAGGTKATQRIIFAAGTIEEEIAANLQAKSRGLETLCDGDLMPDSMAKVLGQVVDAGSIQAELAEAA